MLINITSDRIRSAKQPLILAYRRSKFEITTAPQSLISRSQTVKMPIDHCGIVVPPADLDKTVEFYLKALEPLGYKQMAGYPGVAVGLGDPKTDFWIGANENKVDTGRHIAFSAKGLLAF